MSYKQIFQLTEKNTFSDFSLMSIYISSSSVCARKLWNNQTQLTLCSLFVLAVLLAGVDIQLQFLYVLESSRIVIETFHLCLKRRCSKLPDVSYLMCLTDKITASSERKTKNIYLEISQFYKE